MINLLWLKKWGREVGKEKWTEEDANRVNASKLHSTNCWVTHLSEKGRLVECRRRKGKTVEGSKDGGQHCKDGQ